MREEGGGGGDVRDWGGRERERGKGMGIKVEGWWKKKEKGKEGDCLIFF